MPDGTTLWGYVCYNPAKPLSPSSWNLCVNICKFIIYQNKQTRDPSVISLTWAVALYSLWTSLKIFTKKKPCASFEICWAIKVKCFYGINVFFLSYYHTFISFIGSGYHLNFIPECFVLSLVIIDPLRPS